MVDGPSDHTQPAQGKLAGRAPLVVALLLVTLACLPMLVVGLQAGHSFGYNISWARGFGRALLEGQVYPRWLPDLNGGAGSPVFFFYAPVPFYVHALGQLFASSASAGVQLSVAEWLMRLAATASFYAYARRRSGAVPSAVGALLYALLPYHFVVDGWVRQALGELGAYIFIPLILRSVDRVVDEGRGVTGIAVFIALLCATHLPSTVLFLVVLGLYVSVVCLQTRNLRAALWCGVGVALGMLIAAIYLIPAMTMQSAISVTALWGPFFEYHRWLFGAVSPDPVFSKRLLFVLSASTLLFVGTWLLSYREQLPGARRELWPLLAIVVCAWFLMTKPSQPVWALLTPLQKVQFPWRIAVLLEFAVAATAVIAMRRLREPGARSSQLAAALCGGLTLVSLGLAARSFQFHLEASRNSERRQEIQELLDIGFDAGEYIPAGITLSANEIRANIDNWRRFASVARAAPPVALDAPDGVVRVTRWASRHIDLSVELSRPATAIVRQFYFPGWIATTGDGAGSVSIERAPGNGFLRLSLPAGHYAVALVLTAQPAETHGAIGSAVGLLGLCVVASRRRWLRFVTARKC